MLDVYLLPGLDGTGTLFAPFLDFAPAWACPIVIPYDPDVSRGYEELALLVASIVDNEKPHILLGESFSGPVAILAARKNPENLKSVVLCASFAINPYRLPALLFPPPLFRAALRRPVPDFVLSFFLGARRGSRLFSAVRSTVRSVSKAVLSDRVEEIVNVDVTRELSELERPMLYLKATHDRVVPSASLAEILRIKPETQVKEIASSHLLLQSEPEKAWGAISEFLGVDS